MSHSTDDESHSQSDGTDEVENYESNDADSLNFDEEEEEEDAGSFPLSCNLSDNILGGSIVLHIDQAHHHHHHMMNEPGGPGSRIGAFAIPILPGSVPFENNENNLANNNSLPSNLLQADQSASTTTSLSDTASDNMSTRAVMGDPPSSSLANGFGIGEDDADNSSQASLADSEADRVRRIHNSIFNSLENDLAELVRIREETIQFLESGSRSNDSPGQNPVQNGENNSNETANSSEATAGGNNAERSNTNSGIGGDPINGNRNDMGGDPFFLRERLTFHSRPFPSFHSGSLPRTSGTNNSSSGGDANTVVMNGRTYTPIAKFDNAPPAKPAKPYVESGPVGCDEKAAAARKIMDKLQYGDPEDESACFVRRFWRETTTVDTAPPQVTSPMSLNIAEMAERTASLEATLEEAFDSIRLRLEQAAAESSPPSTSQNQEGQQQQTSGEGNNNENNDRNNAENNGNGNNHQRIEPNSVPYYQAWDEETSIINNPLNYDIWNELDDGNDAGPTITARINLAERRANAVSRIRTNDRSSETRATTAAVRNATTAPGMTSMGVSTSNEGAEMDDDSTDDEEISNYLAYRANGILNRNNDTIQTLSQESRNFFREIGIPEELGRDLFNMFTFSEDEVRIPSTPNNANNGENQDTPEPLFPRNDEASRTGGNNDHRQNPSENALSSVINENNSEAGPVGSTGTGNNNDNEDQDDDDNSSAPQIPLVSTEPGIRFTINRNDDCSTRVYLDEHDLNFPYEATEETNQD